jgi:hypothetical protein
MYGKHGSALIMPTTPISSVKLNVSGGQHGRQRTYIGGIGRYTALVALVCWLFGKGLGSGVVYAAMESTLSSGQLSGLQKDELMEQVKQQIAVANAQELLTVYSI